MEAVRKTRCRTTIRQATESGDVAALMSLFETVAEQEHWQPGEQIGRLSHNARHVVAHVDGELAGGMQVVLPDAPDELPYRAVWPDVSVTAAGRIAEITVLAVCRTFRGGSRLFWPICTELWRLAVAEGVSTVVLQATPGMLDRYRRIGFPLEVIGELREHWGEPCYLCSLDMRRVGGSILELALKFPSYRELVTRATAPRTAALRSELALT